MKLNAVNTRETRQNKSINNKQQNKNINFKGAADIATHFWNFVDKFGRAGQFTVEDMCGTNFPRTYKGAMAGYEYTGQINWASVKQEGLREFLTGPTMTLAPVAILAIATKLSGKSAATHCENITNLSHILSKTHSESLENGGVVGLSKNDFQDSTLKNIISDMLDNSAKDLDKINGAGAKNNYVDILLENMKKYAEIQENLKNSNISKADKKELKNQAEKILNDLSVTFERILKEGNLSYKGVNFQNTKYSTPNGIGETNIKNYIKYVNAFIEDFTKANLDGSEKNIVKFSKKAIDAFEETWLGKRAIVITSMIVLTGIVMSVIPKLYTLASGGVNPNAANIYNEAKKRKDN